MKKIIFLLMILSICCFGVCTQNYNEWIESSFKYIEENRLDSAEVALKNALRIAPANPTNVLLLNNLGTIQRRQGKYNEALESYSLALNRYPKNSTFLSARASLFSEMGNFSNALLDYNMLLEKEPNNQEALYQRGLLYTNMKEFELAEQDFQKILFLNAESLFAYLGLATLCKIDGRYVDAEKIYNYLEEKEPEYPGIYAGRSELFLLLEKGSKALNDINKAIRLSDKEDPYMYIIRSKAKLLLYEKQSAAEDVKKAVTLGYDEKEAEILLNLMK